MGFKIFMAFGGLLLFGWIVKGFLEPFSIAHYWQTSKKTELSGQVILVKKKYKRFSHNHYTYELILKGQKNAPSLHFNERVVSSDLRNELDSTLLDYSKVWKALEKATVNDTIPVKWVARPNKQPIFTSINNEANIGFGSSSKGFVLVGDIIVMVFTIIFFVFWFWAFLFQKY
jgi:hypothetical protein